MSKKVIGIDINEVLRARSLQFDRFYAMEFDGEGLPDPEDPYKFDLRNDYKWEDGEETTNFLNEELPDDISPLDYQIDEKTGKAPVDDFAFRPEKKMVTADEKFKRFIYEDYLYEIHGSAPQIYRGLDKDIEKFYLKYKDQFEIKMVSKENWFTIPPTLFFLSKLMSRLNKYEFFENNDDLWNSVDILLTTDPELITKKPDNKKVVKIFRPYNEKIIGDMQAVQVIELADESNFKETADQFQELIGYNKPPQVEEPKLINEENKQ